jgi:hypothetical protein
MVDSRHLAEFTFGPSDANNLSNIRAGLSLDSDLIEEAASFAINNAKGAVEVETYAQTVKGLKDYHLTLLPANLPKRIDGGNIVIPNFLQAAGFDQVTTIASQSRLTLHYLWQPTDPPFQPFRVLAQDPPAGAEVSPGATITVTVNRKLMVMDPHEPHPIHLGGLTR